MKLIACGVACLAALTITAGASAQDRRTPRPDPADPRAATAALEHRSALSAYRRVGGDDPPPVAWRDANDTVARIGGWRAYAREAQGAAAPASAPAPAPAASEPARVPAARPRDAAAPPSGPSGHKGHGR